MPKRLSEQDAGVPLKGGSRPIRTEPTEMGEFEDEFEDEFESEDEVMEAGVDGRPDAEREADEKGQHSNNSPLRAKRRPGVWGQRPQETTG